jgi:hypothetical protein
MVDWFAMTQEIFSNNRLASFRNTIDGWLLSSSRKIVEMKTGEGKL